MIFVTYRWTVIVILLNKEQIQHGLVERIKNTSFNLHLFKTIDSTNRYLKELSHRDHQIDVCCAEEQTQGRGRFGRAWYSPFAENIYCSSRWRLGQDPSQLAALSLLVSLAVIATLDELKIANDCMIKWPNDILWQGKKLSGILIELMRAPNQNVDAIIGIGLNVNSTATEPTQFPHPMRPWCSLQDITGYSFDRNDIITRLLSQLHQHMTTFITLGFSSFMTTWQARDYLDGQVVTVAQPADTLTGVAKGINDHGQLILIDEHQTVHYLSSGETSLNMAYVREKRK